MYHSWFLVYQRVLLQLHFHLLLHHLHHRIPYLMSTDTPKNPARERSGSTSEERRGDPVHESTETKNKNKNEEREEVQRCMSHELTDWLQEFRENLVDKSTSTEPWEKPKPRKSRHFLFFSCIPNGAASKSGTVFGYAQ